MYIKQNQKYLKQASCSMVKMFKSICLKARMPVTITGIQRHSRVLAISTGQTQKQNKSDKVWKGRNLLSLFAEDYPCGRSKNLHRKITKIDNNLAKMLDVKSKEDVNCISMHP